jgi:putative methionine-R-sulfoxide reductase with GAF domain
MVGPVRTEAGLWAVLEVWSDFRDAFTPHDVKLMDKVVAALAKKTPAA